MKNSTVASRVVAAVLASAAFAASVSASAAPLRVPEIRAKGRHTSIYTCRGGKRLKVSYWNAANGQSFALVPVRGEPLLFVNTIAASGAKYQADRYTWWAKGPRADLYDATAGANAPPILAGCMARH